jgi:DNA primase large subunit
VLAELEACAFRNRTPEETATYMQPILAKHLPLAQNSSRSSTLHDERRKDHYSHFILRLAFAATEDLRRRFSRLETQLFKLRFQSDDARERRAFVESLDFEWEKVGEEERRELGEELAAATFKPKNSSVEEDGWFKVEWDQVPDLVESRRVFLRGGKAYVPIREQMTLVVNEYQKRLDHALDVSLFT